LINVLDGEDWEELLTTGDEPSNLQIKTWKGL